MFKIEVTQNLYNIYGGACTHHHNICSSPTNWGGGSLPPLTLLPLL